jgi:hypothetical protein
MKTAPFSFVLFMSSVAAAPGGPEDSLRVFIRDTRRCQSDRDVRSSDPPRVETEPGPGERHPGAGPLLAEASEGRRTSTRSWESKRQRAQSAIR